MVQVVKWEAIVQASEPVTETIRVTTSEMMPINVTRTESRKILSGAIPPVEIIKSPIRFIPRNESSG